MGASSSTYGSSFSRVVGCGGRRWGSLFRLLRKCTPCLEYSAAAIMAVCVLVAAAIPAHAAVASSASPASADTGLASPALEDPPQGQQARSRLARSHPASSQISGSQPLQPAFAGAAPAHASEPQPDPADSASGASIVRGDSSSAPASPDSDEPLDLAALLIQAERSNLEILAAGARHEAAAHVPSQVEALPDPLASVSYTNESFTELTLGSSEDSNLALSWSQEVPYPGKRRLAGDVARAEIDVSARMLETARLRVRSEVKQAYAE